MTPLLVLALQLLTPIPRWETHGPPSSMVDLLATSADGTIFAAARDYSNGPAALFRSTDDGRTWSRLVDVPSGETLRRIALDSTDSSRMLALTRTSFSVLVYRSDDSGASWELSLTVLFVGQGDEVFFDPARPDTAFLLAADLWRSNSDGLWSVISTRPGIIPGETTSAWISPDGTLFWITRACFQVHIPCYPQYWTSRMYVSGDAGSSASEAGFGACPRRTFVTYASPTVAYSSGAGCSDLFRSGDGGFSWEPYDPSGSLASQLHDDVDRRISQLLVDWESPEALYALTVAAEGPPDGRIIFSRNAGQDWEPVPSPSAVQITAIALDRFGNLVVGTSNGVFVQHGRTRVLEPRN